MNSYRFGIKPLNEKASVSVKLKSVFRLKPLAAAEELLEIRKLVPAILQYTITSPPITVPVFAGQYNIQPRYAGDWASTADAATSDEPDLIEATIYGPCSYDRCMRFEFSNGTLEIGLLYFVDKMEVWIISCNITPMPAIIHIYFFHNITEPNPPDYTLLSELILDYAG